MPQPHYDIIIIGTGAGGGTLAYALKDSGANILLIERGEFCGAKNVSGGILWGRDLAQLVPNYWEQDEGYERFINHRRLTFMDEQSAFSVDFKSSHFDEQPYTGVAVLRARFDDWLSQQA